MNDLVNISIPNAGIIALLGYLVVFLGLVMLMVVVMVMGRIMVAPTARLAAMATMNRRKARIRSKGTRLRAFFPLYG